MFGEIGSTPIHSLDTIIASAFVPLVDNMDENDWGECDRDQRNELVVSLKKFASELSEAIKSMSEGVKLAKPSKEHEIENTPEKIKEAAENEALVMAYEALMGQWITQIKGFVDESSEIRSDANNDGPHTELEYWRARNQKLTSINEQIKTKEVKNVQSVLQFVDKNSGDHQSRIKENLPKLLNEWKDVDMKITEALNEAKDNVKYLTTLEKFI